LKFHIYIYGHGQDLLENGLAASNFAMLGLGDIVIPGIFIALLLRYKI
jgi:minor histocompatibility antigen H13